MNFRVITNSGRHKPDLVGEPAHLSGALEQFFRREYARRQIRIASPAKPATHRAASRNLYQIATAHLGVVGYDLAGRDEIVIEAAVSFLLSHRVSHREDTPWRAVRWLNLAYTTIIVVADLVKSRYVKPRLACKPKQKVIAAVGGIHYVEQRGNQHLTLANTDDIDKVRNWFGVQEGGCPTHDYERMPFVAILCSHGDFREPQKLGNVQVVGFKRDRDREYIELRNWRFRLEREQRALCAFKFRIDVCVGYEHPFAGDSGMRIKELVNRLKTEIRHSYVIGIRICESDVEAEPEWLATRKSLLAS